ncbi:MAG TPA: GlsB/YeaQ/YmgE family stress response membrane protein [Candidatus Acidoferrales bacterium]|nr:GlsB/YeaQ/YmgE family stress response membrane protein [Candidatus Acidoferrales bacterium]
MSIVIWMVFGLFVGLVAKIVMPGRDPGGLIVTILLGIAGAVLGGFLGRALGLYREGDAVGFMVAVLGALVLLVFYRVVGGRTRRG